LQYDNAMCIRILLYVENVWNECNIKVIKAGVTKTEKESRI
jgi:hypothetical protein